MPLLEKNPKEICYRCKLCHKHWAGKFGMNNAEECCKLETWEEILKKREYWGKVKCTCCGKFMKKDGN